MILVRAQWSARAQAHADRVRPWLGEHMTRRSAGRPHAVWDFLFDYYPYSPARLATWHPGVGAVLLDAPAYLARREYRAVESAQGPGASVDVDLLRAAPNTLRRLAVATAILRGTRGRPAGTGCFALHEWAMVYGLTQEQVRHPYLPLRLPPARIVETVDAVGLRCTHFDAVRFFTDEAAPRNAHVPTRATQPADEQPGCLHAAMDLYKYASWFAAYVGSDLVATCFEIAARARELDMRASPYDVSGYGMSAIRVETADGRREYAQAQSDLMAATDPVRTSLLTALVDLRAAVDRGGATDGELDLDIARC